jgi:hypothetical protein
MDVGRFISIPDRARFMRESRAMRFGGNAEDQATSAAGPRMWTRISGILSQVLSVDSAATCTSIESLRTTAKGGSRM